MQAFMGGVLFGFLFGGAIIAIIATSFSRPRKPRVREIAEWNLEHYNKQLSAIPPAATRIIIKERNFQL